MTEEEFYAEEAKAANEQYQEYLQRRGITEEEHVKELMDWCDRQD